MKKILALSLLANVLFLGLIAGHLFTVFTSHPAPHISTETQVERSQTFPAGNISRQTAAPIPSGRISPASLPPSPASPSISNRPPENRPGAPNSSGGSSFSPTAALAVSSVSSPADSLAAGPSSGGAFNADRSGVVPGDAVSSGGSAPSSQAVAIPSNLPALTLNSNLDPDASGNSFVSNEHRVAVEGNSVSDEGVATDLNIVVTPEEGNGGATASDSSSTEDPGSGFTPEEEAFRTKWGWAAYAEAQRAARDASIDFPRASSTQ